MLESHAHCPTLLDGEETMRNPMGAPVSWVTLTSSLPSCPEAALDFWIGAFDSPYLGTTCSEQRVDWARQ